MTAHDKPIPTMKGGNPKPLPMKGGKRSKKSSHSKKSKTKKSKMSKDEAYCLVCRKRVKMSNVKETTTKNNRKMMKADGSCGHTVYRLG
jgi:hypothetical protein